MSQNDCITALYFWTTEVGRRNAEITCISEIVLDDFVGGRRNLYKGLDCH